MLALPHAVLWSQSSVDRPIVITDAVVEYPIDAQAEFLEDSSGLLTIGEVAAPSRTGWQRPGRSALNFGISKSTYWIRFSVRSESVRPDWVLAFDSAILDSITLYSPSTSGTFTERRSGRVLPFGAREFAHRKVAFSVDPGSRAGAVQTFYVRVVSEGSLNCTLSLLPREALNRKAIQQEFLLGLFFGILLIMALYNFSLFISIRDGAYLFYTLFVMAVILLQLSLEGLTLKYLFPERPLLAKSLLIPFQALSVIFALAFSLRFLRIESHAPRLRYALQALMAIAAGYGSWGFFDYGGAVRISALFGGLITPLVLMAVGALAWRRGYRPAKYYLYAWSILLVGTLLFGLRTAGLIPPSFVTEHGSQLGGALEVLLLSLALADRYNLLQKELIEKQSEALRLEKELVAQQRMAAVGSMAAGIAHDFKNPIGVIMGLAEMAEDDSISRDERLEYLRIIGQESKRLASMVQDVMDYSRGSMTTEKKAVDLAEYLVNAERSLKPYFADKGVHFEIKRECAGQIAIDPDRFLRVLINIAGNAADVLSREGRFHIRVRQDGAFVVFELEDNGPGIPESIRSTLFEPFVTLGKSHGTGLGMAITKSMVEAHGGRISFTTQAGIGTRFVIAIPA
ncbi:MAG: sensor histidine kinase [Leptospirales bacterium]|nr:sensor histidine kinase [Leptospirales bacterium]